jgi:DNA polymerase III subunit delta'
MSFKDQSFSSLGVQLLQRSLERGRLAHGYLFSGDSLSHLEDAARNLAKTLNCLRPEKKNGVAIDCCDDCMNCQKIEHLNHGDVRWVRPESKSRVITIDQMREVMQQVNLKPTEADYKVAIIVSADRLNTSAANAFLKTLEEPPARSILVLLTTEPERILETIQSRCLRLKFPGESTVRTDPVNLEWLRSFAEKAAAQQKSLLARYSLLDVLLKKLAEIKASIDETLSAKSPLEQYKDAEKDLKDKWEDELKAAIESEYRRQRSDWLSLIHWWLRDVWLHTLSQGQQPESLTFPDLPQAKKVAARISATDAQGNLQIIEQLQKLLNTNVQEALALEVSLLRLKI